MQALNVLETISAITSIKRHYNREREIVVLNDEAYLEMAMEDKKK